MSNEIKVLDHGYVRFVEAWGHGDAGDFSESLTSIEAAHSYIEDIRATDFECGIIEAARQSTQASFRGWEDVGTEKGDMRLLTYLQNSDPQHATPFEFAGMIIEVQAPFFVVREWQRHRTHSITDDYFSGDIGFNEMSARYAPIPNMNYIPSVERIMKDGGKNKQAQGIGGDIVLGVTGAELFRTVLNIRYKECENSYQNALSNGIPKELARLLLPVARYSRMRITGYLRNWLAFVCLRSHPKAQWEIQEYSRAVELILKEKFPRTYSLFLKRREDGKSN